MLRLYALYARTCPASKVGERRLEWWAQSVNAGRTRS